MDEDIFPDPRTIKATERFVPYKLDVTTDRDLLKKLRPIGTPMFFFIDGEENLFGHMFGPIAPEFYERWTKVVADSYERNASRDTLKAKPIVQAIDFAMANKISEAEAAMGKCDLSKEKASVRDEALMALAQAQMISMRVKDSMKSWQTLADFTKDNYMKSNALSNIASNYMMSDPKKSLETFEAVYNNEAFPEVDRWCAGYQIRMLGFLKKRKG